MLEYNFNWKSLSAVAGLTLLNFYFRLYPGAVKSQQVVDFWRPCGDISVGHCWWSGTGCPRTAADWFETIWRVLTAGFKSSTCLPTHRN